MATTFKGMLTFGLLTLPIKVSPAAREERLSFNQLHHPCGSRINLKSWCPACKRAIDKEEIDKGYEFSKDKYVVVTKEELEECVPDSSRTIEITQCVPASEVDPLLFDASYYLEPESASRRGYKLLLEALKATKQYAIATATMNSREHIVIIRPYHGVLAFHTMFYAEEVRAVPAVGLEGVDIRPAELSLARQLIEASVADFKHDQFRDSYQSAVTDLLEAKQAGTAPAVVPRKPARKETADLMSALTASLKAKPALKIVPKKQKRTA